MFTVVPKETEVSHPPQTEIIDHNVPAKAQTPKWKKGKHTGNVPYDILKDQRDKLIEAEKKYRARIKELESENAELSKTYETTYQENKMLKGILQHGPDAKKIKDLMKIEKEQKGKIDRLQEENETLTKRLNEIEQLYNAKDKTLENTWNELLVKAKKRRPDAEKVPTQGPFAGHTQANEVTLYNQKQEVDSFDVQLDNLEKETQILLNKIRRLQKEKGCIESAINNEKGYITRNAAMNNALNEKLNRDLNKFAKKLEKLKLKHKTAKGFAGVIGKVGHKHAFNLASIDSEESETATSSSSLVPVKGQTNNVTKTVPLTNVKTIEIKSPKLDTDLITTGLKTPKPYSNAKATEMASPKTQVIKPNSKMESHENNNTIVDQRPKTDDHLRSNKIKLAAPRLNKTQDSHRDSKNSIANSNAETNQSSANTVSNFNGSRVTISKTEKQTVITFSPDTISNSENKSRHVSESTSKKILNGANKQNLPEGLVTTIISEDEEKTSEKHTETKKQATNNGKKTDVVATDSHKNQKTESDKSKVNRPIKEAGINGNGSVTGGRYTHGPEPITKKYIDPFEKKPNRYTELYSKRKERFEKENEHSADSSIQNNESGMKLDFTDKVRYATYNSEGGKYFTTSNYKYGFPVRKNSKHIEDDAPNDAVLTYLRNRPKLDENPVSFSKEFADAKEKGSPSPIPIRFNDDAKTVGSDEVKFILTAKRQSYNSVYG